MPRTRDQDEYQAAQMQIKAAARAQMQQHGTTGISLRAIARDLDVTAPALYRYFPSLDDLITALILDAFNGLGEAVENADRAIGDRADYEGRLLAVCTAYRRYAVDHPVDFQLIYGNPIPGYHAPGELTIPAATRTNVALTRVLVEAEQSGAYRPPYGADHTLPPAALERTAAIAAQFGIHSALVLAGTILWSRIHGMVMLEMFGHLDPIVEVEPFYSAEVMRFFRDG